MASKWVWETTTDRLAGGWQEFIRLCNRRFKQLEIALRGTQSSLGWINVKDYGATGNGITDDTAAVTRALTVAQTGDTVYFPKGTYRLSPLTITKAVRLSGYGATIVAISAAVDGAVFHFTGTTGAGTTTLTADAADGAHTLTVASLSSFPSETWFQMEDTSAASSDFAFEWHQVKRASGSTLHLTDPVDGGWAYPLTDTTLTVWLPLEDVLVEGFRMEGEGLQAVGWALVACSDCLRPVIRDVTAHAFGTYGVRFTRCRDWQMVGGGALDATCDLSLASGADAGYGLLLEEGTMHGTVQGAAFRNTRHGIIGATGARYWRAVNTSVMGSYAAAITTHFRRAVDIAWVGNTITGSVGKSPSDGTLPTLGQGLTASTTDTRVTITGNAISHILGAGIYCSQGSLGTADWTIGGNVLTNCAPTSTQSEASLYVANGQGVRIAGNVIRRSDTVLFSGLRVQDCEDVGLVNNSVIFDADQGVSTQIAVRIVDSKRVSSVGNHATITGSAVQCFRVVSTASGDSDVVQHLGNVANVSGGGSAYVEDANATNTSELDNSWNHDGSTTHRIAGDLEIGDDLVVAGGVVELSDAAATARDVRLQTAGVNRWILRANDDAESGSDAGTNLEILARDDSGAIIDAPISIVRAAGGDIALTRDMDFNQHQGIEFVMENRTSDPGSPVTGQLWIRTDL